VFLLVALSRGCTRALFSDPPLAAPLVNLCRIPSAMNPSNRSLIIAILFSYNTFAYFIPPTIIIGSSTASFSIVYPTSTDSSEISHSGSIPTSFPATASRSAPLDPPPIQSDTSPSSEFVMILDNPLIVASLILLIIALTILFAVLFRLRRTRREWRNLARGPVPLPSPPDVYMTPASRSLSLSIKNVVVSPLGSPTLPRAPSPVLSSRFSAHSAVSDFPSSDIHHVQRELRGLSFVPSPGAANSRPASRSSLGTTKTRRVSPVYVWIGEQPRRYGSLWDVEVGRWRDVSYVGEKAGSRTLWLARTVSREEKTRK